MATRLAKRQITGRVTVDGDEYEWEVFREPRWSSQEGLLGLTLSIKLVDHPRELLLEIPNNLTKKHVGFYNQRPKIVVASIIQGIEAAIAAGYRPTSRGKAFAFSMATAVGFAASK